MTGAKAKNSESQTRKNAVLWRTWLLIGFMAAVMFGSMSYIFYVGNHTITTHEPLVDASLEFRLECTMAHVRCEEEISGSSQGDMGAVWQHMDNADWYARAMLEGGQGAEGTFLPLDELEMRRTVEEALVELANFRTVTEKRLAEAGAVSGETEQTYHATFANLMGKFDNVETALQQVIRRDLRNFRILQTVLIIVCVLLAVVVGIVVSRFIHRQINDELRLRAANQQLRAHEQQLRAANQQLSAGEQQLRAANQQLRASEQQLRAANQQLIASEQQLRATNQQLKTSLEEKEVLLREIHHRVKNNLQVVVSLLSLQSENVQDDEAARLFRESQLRVKSMALLHEQLYETENLAHINLGDYVRHLTDELRCSYGADAQEIRFKIDVEDVFPGIDKAVPCALIINELVSNCLKHAFPGDRAGEIRIGLDSDEQGNCALSVSDDGAGFAQDVELTDARTFGLKLVSILAEQLQGAVILDQSAGTSFRISFPGQQREEI
ncbi:MAG: sensor histidine kinase [Planctomycetota bacterium]|jgi:two-component sensor histidine kinase